MLLIPDTAKRQAPLKHPKPLESLLASSVRIENLTNGCRLKRKHAERAVDNCAAAWVEYGVSIRNLTLAESIAARNIQARIREPLPYAEIHGLRFDPPASGVAATRREGRIIWDAVDWLHLVTS